MGKYYDVLSDSHKHFVNEYLTNGYNKTQAYWSMKPTATYETAKTEGYKLSHVEEIRLAISEKVQERTNIADIELSEMTINLSKIMNTSIGDVIEHHEDGSLHLKNLQDIDTYAISSISQNSRGDMKIKMMDKKAAMELYAKLKGMLVEKRELDINMSFSDWVEEVNK
jgi:Ser-tRNA(Ala) deacylase AlaX